MEPVCLSVLVQFNGATIILGIEERQVCDASGRGGKEENTPCPVPRRLGSLMGQYFSLVQVRLKHENVADGAAMSSVNYIVKRVLANPGKDYTVTIRPGMQVKHSTRRARIGS